jgi:hypothetical protein
VDAVRVEIAGLDQLFDFCDADSPGCRRHRIEVARRAPVNEVAEPVALPRGHEREVPDDPLLENALASAENSRLLRLRHQRARACWRIEGGNAGPAGAHLLRQRPLRHKLDLQLAAEELPLELGVLSDVGRHHLAYPLALEENAQTPIVDSTVVRDDRQTRHAAAVEGRDQILRNAAETEPADDQRRTVGNVADRIIRGRDNLVDHRRRS